MADGVPTYVVRNDRNENDEKTLHRAHLLLWIASPEDWNDNVHAHVAIATPALAGTVGEGTAKGDEIPHELSYGLYLAAFRTMIDLPHHKAGHQASAVRSEVLPKGAGYVTPVKEGIDPPMVRDVALVEDVPP